MRSPNRWPRCRRCSPAMICLNDAPCPPLTSHGASLNLSQVLASFHEPANVDDAAACVRAVRAMADFVEVLVSRQLAGHRETARPPRSTDKHARALS
eukprot:COSAG01_NODE_311_length_19072_cov_73.511727_3_plen_97_part_00